MSFNAEILNRFERIHAQGRLAHAYLFIGPEESGKTKTALALAKWLNCENVQGSPSSQFCGECGSCRKIEAGNHPDVMTAQAGVGETIKIEEIRAFIQRIQLRAFEAQWKVFVVRNAERLTKEAANALLKTLEEPNRQTLVVLTTAVPELCLDTIKSRCHAVHFFPQSDMQLAGELIREFGLDEPLAQSLAFFAQGSISRAKALYGSKFNLKKNRIIDEMILKKDSEEFLRKVLSDKEETQTVLRVLLSFFRDLVLVKSGISEDHFANRDRMRELRTLVSKFTFEDLNRIVGEIVKAIQLFKDNLNVKMSLSVIKELVFVK